MAVKIAVILCLFGLARGGNLSGGLGLGQPGFGHSANLGVGYDTNVGHGFGLGYGSTNNLGHGNGWQGYGSGSYEYGGYRSSASAFAGPATSSVSIKKYSGPAVPYSTGFEGHGAYGAGSQGYGYTGVGGYSGVAGYGNTGLAGPATSTVSIKKYSGPAVPYSTGFGGHGAYGADSQGYGYNGLSGYGGVAGYGNSGLAGSAISSVSIKKYLGPDTPYSSRVGGQTAYGAHGQGYSGYGYGAGSYGNKW
ncbi:PREDICTED: glycine-rich cell wall structural protein 1.8-like [Papilio polytes]|uniref:glycine-rich cell wall structural protein 1.8-like n=1 Tax=Papilio polytes TaxID=76194 RepID=UPI0006767465|nr:PREDICTED: glycine-rich cell wall structural protein 1.8-like [Papilio polytes]